MIWTILGLSTAVVAVFCITVAELLVGKPAFESIRVYAALGLGVTGAVAWLLGRFIASRDARRENAPRRFLIADLRYWGPMFLILGVITVFIRPLRSQHVDAVAVVRPAAPKPVPTPVPKPEPVVAKAPPVFPRMRIQGVIYRQAQPFVILNGQSYTIGDRLGDVVVKAIQPGSVMLELEGELKVLTIN